MRTSTNIHMTDTTTISVSLLPSHGAVAVNIMSDGWIFASIYVRPEDLARFVDQFGTAFEDLNNIEMLARVRVKAAS